MKHFKIIALLAAATAVMTAFATSASATILTSPTGTKYPVGSSWKWTASNMKLTGAFVTVECNGSVVQGTITSQGTGVAVESTLSTLEFTECNFPVTVNTSGKWTVTAIGSGNEVLGTLKTTGAEIAISTSLGVCGFTTNGTDVGTFVGGKTASKQISGVIPRTFGNFLCGSSGLWEGTYTIVTPDELWLDS